MISSAIPPTPVHSSRRTAHDATNVWALNARGVGNRKLGKPEKAQLDFEEALRIDSGFEQARKNLEAAPASR